MTTNPPPAPDWDAIRHAYVETDARREDIARDAGITLSQLLRARIAGEWRRSKPRSPPRRPSRHTSATAEPGTDPIDSLGVAASSAVIPASRRSRATEKPGTQKRPRQRSAAANASESAADLVVPPGPLARPVRRRHRRSTKDNLSLEAQRERLRRSVELIDLKLEQLEERMSRKPAAGEADISATDHEREARAIGVLVENQDKVNNVKVAIDRLGGSSDNADLARETERYRRELSSRLQKLVDARRAETK